MFQPALFQRVLSGLVLVWLCSAPSRGDDAQRFVGDYAGWAYQHDGGDFPLRLHCRAENGALTVRLDAPSQKAYDLPTTDVKTDPARLRFQRRNSQGNLWSYTGELADGVLRGEASFDGQPACAFELHRAAEPLPTVLPERYADCVGTYRLGRDRTIVISSWFWGELRFTDTLTGRHGTLFATSDSEFFVGPALYVPAPIFARLIFVRNDNGQVERLVWRQGDEPPQTGTKLRFIEEEAAFANSDVRLRGTLVKPDTPGPHPAIVVLGGSNWRIRCQTRGDADLFVSLGLAALVYDQRGNGESTGAEICSFEDTAADARAAVAWLKNRKDIRPDRIGLSGRSRGGWFAPLAASKCQDVAFLVLFVPPAISPARQETTRRLNEMRAAGHNEADVKEGAAYLELLWRCGASDADWQRYCAAREKMAANDWLKYLGGSDTRDSDDFAWDRLNMQYDPRPALEKTTGPVLALFGELDTNVVPAENLPLMEAMLKKAGNRDFSLKIVPGADHGLRRFDPRQPRLPLHRATGFAPEQFRLLQEWLASHAGTR